MKMCLRALLLCVINNLAAVCNAVWFAFVSIFLTLKLLYIINCKACFENGIDKKVLWRIYNVTRKISSAKMYLITIRYTQVDFLW